ncbi:MAG: DUF2779 domain-containing protein [archaeon]|nr:DUF2779 domain-containing protein [archaeon]
MGKILTKSKYLSGLQCPKLLWITFNQKDLIPQTDEATQFTFDQGHIIGELAKKRYPKGIDIQTDDFKENLNLSKELLKKRVPLFEPAYLKDNIYARADILNPKEDNTWDIIEVKSATKVKDVNIHDVSFQKYCYEKAGLKINKCYLMHLNSSYKREDAIDPEHLFTKTDITDEVNRAITGIKERTDEMLRIIDHKKAPETDISQNCNSPYPCPLKDICWKHIPKNSIFDLSRAGKKAFELYNDGIISIKDIPDNTRLTDKQNIQKLCELTKTIHINRHAINNFLNSLTYPLYFLDFETVSTAVPMFSGTRPYQQISFQYSLHISEDLKKDPKHHEYLAKGKNDPRIEFAENLKKVLGNKGSIIVYNQSFEIARMKEIAEAFPKHKEWVNSLLPRFIDLIIPFRNFQYYNPAQSGSASIKKVLPAVTGISYKDMDIGDGITASREFLKTNYNYPDNKKPTKEDIKKVRKDLEAYCGLDTEGMLFILRELNKISQQLPVSE